MADQEENVVAPGGPRPKSSVHWVHPGQAVSHTPAGALVITEEAAKSGDRNTEMQDDMVRTPGGIRARSVVHKVEAGTVLDGADGRLRNLDAAGTVLSDFGVVERRTHGMPLMPLHIAHPDRPAPAFGTGWITYASWTNSTGNPVSLFSTQWVVPPEPIARAGQTIFLFNGIQNSTMIYQPVLQWGSSAAGGGNYWAVASWYADGQGGPAFHSNLVQVKPGELLTGIMTLTSQSGTQFSYNCEFQGIANSGLPISNVDQLTWCIETLECYGIEGASSYPVTFRTPMKAIDIMTGATHPAISWAPTNSITDCGQHTVVVNNSSTNGEVDLCYGTVGPASVAAVSWSPNRLDLLGLGNDNQMYHKAWNGIGWYPSLTGWEPLGGTFDSPPAVASWGANRLDIFGLGNDNQMYHKAWNGIGWYPSLTGWEPLGGTFDSPPAVASWGANRLDIFGLGNDNQMYHKAWNGSQWLPSATGWEALGGTFNSAPAVVAWGPNRLDIFGLGNDNQMYHKAWNGSQWLPSATGWEALGGTFNSAPAVVAWGPNRLDIFGLGNDNQMYHKAWNGSQWLPSATGWEALGGTFNSAPAVVAWGPNRLDIFGLGNDNQMYHKAWNGSQWLPSATGWEALGGTFNSAPTVAAWGANRLDIVGLGDDNQMYHKAWNGIGWYPSLTGWEALGGTFDAGSVELSSESPHEENVGRVTSRL